MISREQYYALLRVDFTAFMQRCFYELNGGQLYLPSRHIEVMTSALEQVRRGECRRLILNLPPRHLKSECASVAFPAWYLGHFPDRHVVCASFGQDLAEKLAERCRKIMESDWYQAIFDTRLVSRRVNDFTTTAGGTRKATSVTGSLTGRGADLIILDDPLKPEEALSEVLRTAVNNWYGSTLCSRLNDKELGAIVMAMQRLHQDDLTAHVLEQEPWNVIRFPAIAVEDEVHVIDSPFGRSYFRRKAGEPLQPARESLVTLGQIRKRMGEYHFQSQYQQDPTPVDGNMVKSKWLQYYGPGDKPTSFAGILQSWDTASKAEERNDYSVCVTIGIHDGRYYVLDVFRERLEYPDLKRAVLRLARQYSASTVLIEDRASGQQLIQDLPGEGLLSVRAYDPPARADKLMRMHVQTPAIENGRLLLPTEAPWLEEYRRELTGFPGAKYDDQVDATSQALDYLGKDGATLMVWTQLGQCEVEPILVASPLGLPVDPYRRW